MPEEPSYTQLVVQVLRSAARPLTVDEILARVALVRPLETRNPASTVRNAITSERRVVTLGGRPAHYSWWPRHLAGNTFRQPLRASDLAAGTLVLAEEVWYALWPDFHAGPSRSKGTVTLHLEGGPALHTHVSHLVAGKAVWGIHAESTLSAWLADQDASPNDDLIVRVLDVDGRRYALSLDRHVDREAIGARDRALADIAERVLRGGRDDMPYFDLVPRTIAHDAFCHPVPPEPVERVLRADLRFVPGRDAVSLTGRLVAAFEREMEVPPDPHAFSRPSGRAPWRGRGIEGYEEGTRRAWAAYLFDRGMDHLWVGWPGVAEAYYHLALQLDDGHADAWVHVGNRRLDEGQVEEALACYGRGISAAQARTIGVPDRYPGPFWLDVDSRPFMRAAHGKGLCLWRLERVQEARVVFQDMLRWNASDNQGVRFLLHDLDEGLSWEESVARDETQGEG
ncbi:MAG TPA: hypothetical protein VM366_18470 [Anaerolineae bacterium]|nr:hypothetical protein [Anaerolineae bacterium]